MARGGGEDGKVARRMLAVALVLERASRNSAAESCGMDRQTLRDWVHRYNEEGIEGLANRGGGGVKPRLTPDQIAPLSSRVEAGPDPERDGVVRGRHADRRVGLRPSSALNWQSARSAPIWPSWAFAGCWCAPNTPMPTLRRRPRSKKRPQYRSGHPAVQGKGKAPGDMVSRVNRDPGPGGAAKAL